MQIAIKFDIQILLEIKFNHCILKLLPELNAVVLDMNANLAKFEC